MKTWKLTVPAKPGVYLFREHEAAPCEPVLVYECRADGWPRYRWVPEPAGQPPLLLAKRVFEPEAITADAMQGLYLCAADQEHPEPLEVPRVLSASEASRERLERNAKIGREEAPGPAPEPKSKGGRRKSPTAADPEVTP